MHNFLMLAALTVLPLMVSCCTSTLQEGCDPKPKWVGYSLQPAN